MIFCFGGAIRGILLNIIFIFGQVAASDGLTNYVVPAGYYLHVYEEGTQTIRMMRHAPERPAQCLGWVTFSWEKIDGRLVRTRIKHLETDPRVRGRGVGSRLFDLAAYTLIKRLGAAQVGWCAKPLDSSRTLDELIQFYEQRGGEMSGDLPFSGEMCLTEVKIAEICAEAFPKIDENEGEVLATNTKIEKKVALKSVERDKNQCVLRCVKYENDDWLFEKPYHYTQFGIEQSPRLLEAMAPLRSVEAACTTEE